MRSISLLLCAACGAVRAPAVDLAPVEDGAATLAVSAGDEVDVRLPGARVVEAAVDGQLTILPVDGGWVKPHPATGTVKLAVVGRGEGTLTVWLRGAPVPAARRERALTWTDPALLDDPTVVGLAKVMGTIAADGHGGRMLDAWFRRFATTAHSERAAPAELMDEIAAAQGADPSRWDLDKLPFRVTAVHNRLDLAPRDAGCGQLRISMASTHPIYAPLHVIFLFRQKAEGDDVAPDGTIHCLGTARRWARLGALDGEAWRAAARAFLAERLLRERFLLAETLELTEPSWEWRQWAPQADGSLDNPPLFQTVDTEGLNPPGPRRDRFLAFVAANAAALDARTLEIPDEFRAPSARVPQAPPRPMLDIGAGAAGHPTLRQNIEIVGCPTCHTDRANFVQTNIDRTFSPFYTAELVARGARLDAMNAGQDVPIPPYGPLQ